MREHFHTVQLSPRIEEVRGGDACDAGVGEVHLEIGAAAGDGVVVEAAVVDLEEGAVCVRRCGDVGDGGVEPGVVDGVGGDGAGYEEVEVVAVGGVEDVGFGGVDDGGLGEGG